MNRFLALALGIVMPLSACASSTPSVSVEGTTWVVTRIATTDTIAGHQPTIEFADKTASGNASCNRFSTSYTLTGTTLSFGANAAVTQMACEPSSLMTQETAFTAALVTVSTIKISGDTAELLNATGATVLSLTKQVDRDIVGTTWKLTGITTAQAVSSPYADSAVTITISDGELTGKACNTFSGTAKVDGTSFSAGPFRSTKMACPNAELTAQEHKVLTILEAADQVTVTGNQLTISASDGTGLEFVAK